MLGHLTRACPDLLGYNSTAFVLVLEDYISMHKWVLAPTSICECGALDQAASHLILEWLLHSAPKGYHRLLVLDGKTRCWLNIIGATFEEDLP